MPHYYIFNKDDQILLINNSIPTILPPNIPLENCHAFAPEEYLYRLQEHQITDIPSADFLPLRSTYTLLSQDEYQRAGKAWELLYWNEQTHYCSLCGAPMTWHSSISLICTQCGREIWPQLNIAIIVLVHKDEKALLVKAKSFRRDFFGLVAGFVETGEDLEECVAREVMEETSIHINHIRYFASQPWPYPLGLMVGFHADYVDGEICFADGELKEGAFFSREELPRHADGSLALPGAESMARRLIDDWILKSDS